MLFPNPKAFWGAFPQIPSSPAFPGTRGAPLPSTLRSYSPSIIWLLGSALCVGVCFSCFLTHILFGGVGLSLSRWSPSQDILQSICEPETTGNSFFFFLIQEGPSVCFMLSILFVNLKACSLCKTTLWKYTRAHTHAHTHRILLVKKSMANSCKRKLLEKDKFYLFKEAGKPFHFCDFAF